MYQKEVLDPAKEHNVVLTNLPSRTDRAGELPSGITIPQHTTLRLSIARSLAGESAKFGLDTTYTSFNGSSVQLLGSLYSDHGNYTVTYAKCVT